VTVELFWMKVDKRVGSNLDAAQIKTEHVTEFKSSKSSNLF
jgi:hypothetical protein